jgi:hypothetical protein
MCGNTGPPQVHDDDTCTASSSHAPSACTVELPGSTTRQPWYAANNDGTGSDASELSDEDDNNAVDLEVNFESEADVLGVETSGDELDRGGTSRDFSEMSSQLTERGISDDDDGNGSSPSGSDDVMFSGNRRLLSYARSGSDLSWDESADLPSFAIAAGCAPNVGELNGLLQFSKS